MHKIVDLGALKIKELSCQICSVTSFDCQDKVAIARFDALWLANFAQGTSLCAFLSIITILALKNPSYRQIKI